MVLRLREETVEVMGWKIRNLGATGRLNPLTKRRWAGETPAADDPPEDPKRRLDGNRGGGGILPRQGDETDLAAESR